MKTLFIKNSCLVVVVLALAGLLGCAAQRHTSKMSSIKSSIVKQGNLDVSSMEKKVYDRNGNLERDADLIDMLELGAVYPLSGNFQNSNKVLESAYVRYTQKEERAKINARGATTGFLDILVGEGSGEYAMASYEKVFIHNIKMMNFLMMGRSDAARVEVLRAINCQRQIREYAEFEAAQINKEKVSVKQKARKKKAANPEIDKQLNELTQKASLSGQQQQAIRNVRSSYENGYTYLLSALIFGLTNEVENARPQLKNASALTGNRYVQQLYRDFQNDPASLTSKNNLFVFAQVGFAPYKENFQLPFYNPVSKTVSNFSLARIHASPNRVNGIDIVGASATLNNRMETLVDLDLLALKQYDEDLPANITKAALRVVSQTLKDKVILDELGKMGGRSLSLFRIQQSALSLVNQVLYKADIRAWNTAPKRVLFFCGNTDASRITVKSTSRSGRISSREIDINPQRLNVVSIRCLDQKLFVNSQAF